MDSIARPVQAVRALYAAKGPDADEDFGVAEHFAALLADPALAAQVGCGARAGGAARGAPPGKAGTQTEQHPLIPQVPELSEATIDLLPDQSLVRLRGMVRTMGGAGPLAPAVGGGVSLGEPQRTLG